MTINIACIITEYIHISRDCLDNANSPALQISFASAKLPGGHNVVAAIGVARIVDYQHIRVLLVQCEYDQTVRGNLLNTTTLDRE